MIIMVSRIMHGLVTLIDKTQSSDPTKREYSCMRTLMVQKHTIHMVWILRRYISGCYFVGLLHDFVRFFRCIKVYLVKCMNAFTGFAGTVLGQDYWDTASEFLILLLVHLFHHLSFYLLRYFSFYPQDTPFKLGLHMNFFWRLWRYMGFLWIFSLHRVSIEFIYMYVKFDA